MVPCFDACAARKGPLRLRSRNGQKNAGKKKRQKRSGGGPALQSLLTTGLASTRAMRGGVPPSW
jgi:hypothetical protein